MSDFKNTLKGIIEKKQNLNEGKEVDENIQKKVILHTKKDYEKNIGEKLTNEKKEDGKRSIIYNYNVSMPKLMKFYLKKLTFSFEVFTTKDEKLGDVIGVLVGTLRFEHVAGGRNGWDSPIRVYVFDLDGNFIKKVMN